MSSRPPTPKKDWLPYAGLMLTVGGIIYQGGQLTSNVTRNAERITTLEATVQARSDAINAINVRTARMEAKLDYSMPRRDEEERRQ